MLDPSSLEALALRVESGSGGDHALDGLVWKSVVEQPGDVWHEFHDSWHRRDPLDRIAFEAPPPLTSSLDAVKALIGAKLPGWAWCCGTVNEDDMEWATVTEPDGGCRDFTGAGPDVVRALLAACLRALAQKEEG